MEWLVYQHFMRFKVTKSPPNFEYIYKKKTSSNFTNNLKFKYMFNWIINDTVNDVNCLFVINMEHFSN